MKHKGKLYGKVFEDYIDTGITGEEVSELEKENKEIKEVINRLLPENCIKGYENVKFCSYRNGEGNECRQCADKII